MQIATLNNYFVQLREIFMTIMHTNFDNNYNVLDHNIKFKFHDRQRSLIFIKEN